MLNTRRLYQDSFSNKTLVTPCWMGRAFSPLDSWLDLENAFQIHLEVAVLSALLSSHKLQTAHGIYLVALSLAHTHDLHWARVRRFPLALMPTLNMSYFATLEAHFPLCIFIAESHLCPRYRILCVGHMHALSLDSYKNVFCITDWLKSSLVICHRPSYRFIAEKFLWCRGNEECNLSPFV